MRKSILSIALVALSVAGLSLAAAACGGSSPAGAAAAGTSASPGTIQNGGTLTVNQGIPAGKFGFPLTIMQADQWYSQFFLEPLVRTTDKVSEFKPVLATSWEIDQKAPSITFHLRPNVKFTDGTPLDAAAVKFNYDILLKAKFPLLSLVKSVDVVDPSTVRVDLLQWDNTFMVNVSTIGIFSPTAYKKMGADAMETHPVGTGPFILDQFQPNQVLKVKKNPNYWDTGLPHLDEVVCDQIPDPMTALSALQTGELQGINNMDPVSASQLTKQGGWQTQEMNGATVVLSFNSDDPNSVWSDARMRQALEYAIDKVSITNAAGFDFMPPSYEVAMGTSLIADPGTTPRTYNVQKAKQLMAAAGHPNGVSNVKLTYEVQMQPKDAMAALAQNLDAVGIHVTLNGLDQGAFNALSFKPAPGNDLMMVGVRGTAPNVLMYTAETFGPHSTYMPGVARPAGFYALLQKALAEPTMSDATPDVVQLNKLLYNDATVVPLWTDKFVSVSAPTVHDLNWFQGGMPSTGFQYAWLSK